MRELTVYLNRDGLNSIETAEQTVRTADALSLVLKNHGKPTHVHFHPDDALAGLGTIEDPHVFVPEGEWRQIEMQFGEATSGSGQLEITAGYGKERAAVTVEVDRSTDRTAGTDGTSVEATPGTDAAPDPPRTVPALIEAALDVDRLRNPVVLGSAGAGLLLFVLLVFLDPVAALFSAVIGTLLAIAIAGYLTDWNPLPRNGR
ncbi:MAG: hypothetical protein ABEJ60_08425 [Halodesulfurarchaeum sp.]